MNPNVSGWRFPLKYSIKRKMIHILGAEYYLDAFGSPVY
jgi:hypothetical protein